MNRKRTHMSLFVLLLFVYNYTLSSSSSSQCIDNDAHIYLRKRKSRHLQETKNECRALLTQELTVKQIHEKTGISESTLFFWKRKYDLNQRIPNQRILIHSQETKNECRALLTQGLTVRQIHEHTGISESTLYYWQRQYGLNKHASIYSQETKSEFRAFLAQGVTIKQIHEKTGISKATLYYWQKEQDLLLKASSIQKNQAQLIDCSYSSNISNDC